MPGDRILVDMKHFESQRPSRGDVVVVTRPDNPKTEDTDESETKSVRRIIGVGGDTVSVVANNLYLNDRLVEEPFTHWPEQETKIPRTAVPTDHVFLWGDNRTLPGRDLVLHESRLLGKVLYVYWPPGRMGISVQ